jgi:hypothetical protein
MFSTKFSGSQLKALREIEQMLVKANEFSHTSHSSLLHATVSGSGIARLRRTLKVKGAVVKGRESIPVKGVIELVQENDIWYSARSNLLLGDEHYVFTYNNDKSYITRSYKNQFPD